MLNNDEMEYIFIKKQTNKLRSKFKEKYALLI